MRKVLYILCFLALSAAANAQSVEGGILVGASNYHGDLAYNPVASESNFSGGIFYRHSVTPYWSIRPALSVLQISGSDANFEEYHLRNLSFRNTLYEASTVMEFNFRPFSARKIHNQSTFYALIGVAGFLHKPEAEINGQWVDLHSQNTEQLDPKDHYKLFQLSVPFGVGVKYAPHKNIVLGFETVWRKTFTDYLDDVSTVYPDLHDPNNPIPVQARQLSDRSWEVSETGTILSQGGDMRGDPNLKDWYFQAAFTISYRFTPIVCPYKRYNFFD